MDLSNPIQLLHPLRLKADVPLEELRTVGDVVLFLNHLPADQRGKTHWLIVEEDFEEAARHPANQSLLNAATLTLEAALRTSGMLKE